jgi:hypothetical protein
VILCYLRIGRAGSLVDNHYSGGIVAPIDLETGSVHAAIDGLPERDVYTCHPDHGALIEGQRIPFFSEALSLPGGLCLRSRSSGSPASMSP